MGLSDNQVVPAIAVSDDAGRSTATLAGFEVDDPDGNIVSVIQE